MVALMLHGKYRFQLYPDRSKTFRSVRIADFGVKNLFIFHEGNRPQEQNNFMDSTGKSSVEAGPNT